MATTRPALSLRLSGDGRSVGVVLLFPSPRRQVFQLAALCAQKIVGGRAENYNFPINI